VFQVPDDRFREMLLESRDALGRGGEDRRTIDAVILRLACATPMCFVLVALCDSKCWVFRYARGGKKHDRGLGPFHTIGLSEARRRAAKARRLLLDGRDPIEEKRSHRPAQ
jgi:hypothetical protein